MARKKKVVAAAPGSESGAGSAGKAADAYSHREQAVQRPDVGVQEDFQARKPPKTYRYDSSLDPELSWDENAAREQAEWLLALIERAAEEGKKARSRSSSNRKSGAATARVSTVCGPPSRG